MYNSDNENFHHSKFAWYAKRSSLADINPMSHYLTAFSLLNPLRYVYLHALNVEFFFERSEVYVAVICCVVIS